MVRIQILIVLFFLHITHCAQWAYAWSIPSPSSSIISRIQHPSPSHHHVHVRSSSSALSLSLQQRHGTQQQRQHSHIHMNMNMNMEDTTTTTTKDKRTKATINNINNNPNNTPVSLLPDPNKVYYPPSGCMNGKTVIITGAASGLGLESAKRLSAAGANVVVTARSRNKTIRAVQIVRDYLDDYRNQMMMMGKRKGVQEDVDVDVQVGHVIGVELELEDLNSVKTFAARYLQAVEAINTQSDIHFNKHIHVLLNNAGMGGMPQRQFTVDGYERTFQANHLGHFVLTSTLFPLLNRSSSTSTATATGGCRVINVSSLAHAAAHLANQPKIRGLDIRNIIMADLEYSMMGPYQQSKLANVLFTQELQRRANKEEGMGDWLTVVSLEPGVVSTNIWRYVIGRDPRGRRGLFQQQQQQENDYDYWEEEGMDGGGDGTCNKDSSPPSGIGRWLLGQVFYRILTPTDRGSNAQIYLSSVSDGRRRHTNGGGVDGNDADADADNGDNNNGNGNSSILEGGCHYGPDMRKMELEDFARDEEMARLLWEKSEECAGIKFDLSIQV